MMKRLFNKKLGLEPNADEGHDDIVKLQGINRPIVERLADEDVTTITQIAYCDPVRLVMRSNLTFNFVTECMNQALAWLYFEDKLAVLRPLGLRGAVEIRCLIEEYDDIDTEPTSQAAHDRAVAALPHIAQSFGQPVEAFQIALRQIADDPYTVFLAKVWPA